MTSLTAPTTSVKKNPLLFTKENRDLVRRRLKWETRRGMKLSKFPKLSEFKASSTPGYDFTFRDRRSLWNDLTLNQLMEYGPYGNPESEEICYWMREPVQVLSINEGVPTSPLPWVELIYLDDGLDSTPQATEITVEDYRKLLARKDWRKPSTALFMLKSFTRTWLKGVRVWTEQLGEISEESAVAEGCEASGGICSSPMESVEYDGFSAYDEYRHLWESINGSGSWNPDKWVWCIEFELMGGES